ncbi:MAG: glycosyltransferase family 4 protein [Candidatus Moranbacteria bacterium]|nr:glycosyltransferase family 4 protein [Candidatus Moranbacteria bacterium]
MTTITIQAADLDAKRIDGTRVYIHEMLKRFGILAPENQFNIYHRTTFNKELAPPQYPNYTIHTKNAPFSWTQTRFSYELWKNTPDKLWMPMHALPIVRPKKMVTIVTIHDLAFKIYPELFPPKDRHTINAYTNYAVKNADRLITVSNATKNDLLTMYPFLEESRITVVHHGVTKAKKTSSIEKKAHKVIYKKLGVEKEKYLLYVGAIQPRKNLHTLIAAYTQLRKKYEYKLVLAGEKAWMWEETIQAQQNSKYKDDIIITGTIPFETREALYAGALTFVYPSLYEGFGIPIIEAFSRGVPVVCAQNSSLPEVGGEAPEYCDANNVEDMANAMDRVISNLGKREIMSKKGLEQAKKFSWDNCAQKTLQTIENAHKKKS